MADRIPSRPDQAAARATVTDGLVLTAKRLGRDVGTQPARIARLSIRLPHGATPEEVASALSEAVEGARMRRSGNAARRSSGPTPFGATVDGSSRGKT